MTLTLLLDLDDTLLDSNIENFIPAYFQALSETLGDLVSPEIMLPALMGGTKRMMSKTDPSRTLSDVFDEYFYAKLGQSRQELQHRIDGFYDDVFPKLSNLTRQLPEAILFVRWAFEQGFRIVIATNPLFPLKAINHRLRWAGLAPENFLFTLVTSYEDSHFTKENITYFPEILGRLGWPDDPVVMVGNDLNMDIEPALASGIPVFWVRNEALGTSENLGIPQGLISDVRPWLESIQQETLQYSLEKTTALLAALRAMPAILEGYLLKLNDENLKYTSNTQDWSISDGICHLRDVEIEVNFPRIQKILSFDNPFLVGEITDRWVVERDYASQSGRGALTSFTNSRIDIINILARLHEEWDRPARHSIFGSSTLRELVGVMVGHDIAHVRQINHTMELLKRSTK
jgi:FMN phosphatase YigB (HAD superfamily)